MFAHSLRFSAFLSAPTYYLHNERWTDCKNEIYSHTNMDGSIASRMAKKVKIRRDN